MEYRLRFFVDGSPECKPEHQFVYTHAATMIIPQIGSTVFLNNTGHSYDDEYVVTNISYDVFTHDNLGLIDVCVTSVPEGEW